MFIVIKKVINKSMKHLFHLSRKSGGNKSLPGIFWGGGEGEGVVPCFVKVFSAFLRFFRACFWFSIRCSGFSERCSGVFRVFWKLLRDIPGFPKSVPGCSGFSGTVP